MHPVKRVDPLYQQIYKRLEAEILEGKIMPGERLIDTKIASDLGVSRSPVREAFRKLERDGLLVNDEGNISVFTPTLQDAKELYQVRIGLEAIAAYWAAKNMKEDELECLSQVLIWTEQAIEQKNTQKIIALNTKFHESIITYSRNNQLKKMMDNIRSLIQICRNTIIKQYNRSDSFLAEHYSIFRALSIHEPELAAKKMEQHIQRDMKHFEDSYICQNQMESITNRGGF
ncbi:GntR family transcriptional regulator [Peribacillus kribbensis]|uniref:GntR family transcriptional regulator n=1 Tax=Peribacillus kribbensis TaxID=356658 RepID=UPI00040DCB0C|nr:GntR family transcriptional regulator [Peribacillus kribbensis]